MYNRAGREAIKIAEKAGPAVIIWFRPLAINRPEPGDISLASPFPDLTGKDGAIRAATGALRLPGWRCGGDPAQRSACPR